MRLGVLAAGATITVAGFILLAGGGALGVLGMRQPAPKTGKIDLRLDHKPTVMTAAYKVYGSPTVVGGKYWLGKLTVKNSGDGPLKGLKVSYQIPEYIGWTTPSTFNEILPGQTVVEAFYPRFPAKVAQISSMTPTSLEVKLEYDDGTGHQERIERREFYFRGVTEIEYSSLPASEIVTFYDMFDNSELNCAWVTEEDAYVRAFYGKVSERAGGFGTMDSGKDVLQFCRSTYDFMVAMGMTYSGTKGVAEKKGDEYVLVQSMRLPRALLQNNTGLCVELAQLWASLAISSGAKAYLVMIPGHCFPVIAAGDGTLIPVEATGISGGYEGGNLGGPMTFEQAVEVATKNFNKVRNGETTGQIIDVLEYRNEGIRPPELGDGNIAAFTKELDERLARRGGGGGAAGGGPTLVNRTGAGSAGGGGGQVAVAGGGEAGGGDGGTAWTDPDRRLSMTIPAGWVSQPQVVSQMQAMLPGYVLSVMDPRTQCGIDVIYFKGATSADQVVGTLGSIFRGMGFSTESGTPETGTIGGKQAVIVPIMVTSSAAQIGGAITVVPVTGGMVALNVGGPRQNLQAALPQLEQVVNTVKFAR
jgi:hypothetical protein